MNTAQADTTATSTGMRLTLSWMRISERAKDRVAWAVFALALTFVLVVLGYGALLLTGAD
jgi:hypothetical protein